MSFWKTFWHDALGTETEKGFPPPTRPAPPMPTIKEPKRNISEPVLSLVKTIENDEWELGTYWGASSLSRGGIKYIAKHVWLGKRMCFKHTDKYDADYQQIPVKFVCLEEWMNEVEKEYVAEAMWKAYELHYKLYNECRKQRVRESFMIFTGEY